MDNESFLENLQRLTQKKEQKKSAIINKKKNMKVVKQSKCQKQCIFNHYKCNLQIEDCHHHHCTHEKLQCATRNRFFIGLHEHKGR